MFTQHAISARYYMYTTNNFLKGGERRGGSRSGEGEEE